jgi:anti-anti-sigma factor
MRYKQVKLEGNLIFSAPLAKQKIKESIDNHFVELDLSSVDTIDSTGITLILDLAKSLKEKKGALRLIEVKKHIADTLKMSGMDTVVEIQVSGKKEN